MWVDFAKKINENSEMALSESMLQGNVMAYAQLKCWYGWSEAPQKIEITGPQAPALSQDEIHQIAEQAANTSTAELLEGLPDE